MKSQLSIVALAFAALLPFAAHADTPGQHPAYLHALTGLRDARPNLDHRPGDPAVSGQEHVDRAIAASEHAIRDVGYHR
jgi:hypothetical protein